MGRKKDNRGGKREGAGRKKGEPTLTVTIRHTEKAIKKLRKKYTPSAIQQKGREWIDKEIND